MKLKLFATFFGSVLSAQTYAGANIIDCPGRCWEKLPSGECNTMLGKLNLDCSTVGTVVVEAHACLFTPENAEYSQNYTVFFGDAPAANHCEMPIAAEDDKLVFNMTYGEAKVCGWEWGSTGDNITFGSFIRPSDNINKVLHAGFWVTISEMIQNIDLTCVFDSKASVSIEMDNLDSTAQQQANQSEFISLADGFSIELYQGTDQRSSFVIGQQVTAKFVFDHQAAGYALGLMPFGFFAERCMVENRENLDQKLFLIGSAKTPVKPVGANPDTCIMDQSLLNLNVNRLYKNETTGNYTDLINWTVSKYMLKFDAFKIGGSSNLKLTCDFELCLKENCPAFSAVDCP